MRSDTLTPFYLNRDQFALAVGEWHIAMNVATSSVFNFQMDKQLEIIWKTIWNQSKVFAEHKNATLFDEQQKQMHFMIQFNRERKKPLCFLMDKCNLSA